MSNQDIRDWAAVNGWDISSKGRISQEVKDAYTAASAPGQEAAGTAEPAAAEPADDDERAPFAIVPDPAAIEPRTVTPERPAAAAERPPDKPAGRRRRGFQRRPKPPSAAGVPHKRVSLENVVSSGWALGAMALARSPQAVPMARVLDMQAPVAGIIGEDLLRGTLADRILQPFARGGKKAEMGLALAGPPLLVGIMTAQPQLAPALRPMLKMAMMSWMEISEPGFRKVQKRAQDWGERFGDVDLDAMIDALWADVPVAGPPSAQEEENIRRARGE